MRWTVLIPLKSLPQAKSRLRAGSDSAPAHAELVAAIRADTLAAVHATPDVARALVIVDRPGGEGDAVLLQTSVGLNPAIEEGATHARGRWATDGIAALVGDLPALSAAELAAALTAAAEQPRSFVADAAGTGTTLLAARPGVPLHPAFGDGSAARHGLIAVALPAGPGLRHDVDTPADLQAAAKVGLGRHTRAALLATRARSA